MPFFFPRCCGWGYRWWWNGADRINIGVSQGSIGVARAIPVAVEMLVWPPQRS